jgi:CRP-like cAMP-binding protein
MAEEGVFAIFTRNSDDYETYAAGAEVFREGDTGDCLYVVRSGVVDLLKGEIFLDSVEPGGAFGEMVLTGRPERSATAVAREETTVVRVDQARFDRVMSMNPFLARAFMRLIADRLSAMNERLKALS